MTRRPCCIPLLGLAFSFILLLPHPARALIGVPYQMPLGNPSGATADTNNHSHYLIQRPIQALDYNDSRGQANWASWSLTSGDANNAVARQDSFAADTSLPPNFYLVQDTEYSGSGYDRGHLCPSADRTDSLANNDMTFLMSNMMPQAPDNNRITWAGFEDYCRTLADAGNEVFIICGPSGFNGSHISSSTHVLIASNTWKIAVIVPLGAGPALNRIDTTTNRVIALRVPNLNGVSSTWQSYITTARTIELETGFSFFTALPGPIASAFRSRVDGLVSPPAPSITSFTPGNGLVNSNVTLTGANFTSASAVLFNGVATSFFVDSATQITAVVPNNATTGPLAVTTPGGTAFSATSFTIATVTNFASPDLALSVAASPNFTQGDLGKSYVISVTNFGAAVTVGSLSLSNTLPAGFTATTFSGAGWSTTLSPLTATRSDALNPGTGFPTLTLTVNVATNAPASVTNVVTLTGGGDTNLANNLASTVTTIAPLATNGGGSTTFTNVLVGWDFSALPGGANNFGPSPMSPSSTAAHLTVVGLTRGAGILTANSGALRGWGGNNFIDASSAAAITGSRVVMFSVVTQPGFKVSYSGIPRFDYRRSATGPTTGLLQYQLNAGVFTDIATVAYTSVTNFGASLNPIDLSSIGALQNVGVGTNVTFRLVNWGGTSSAGTWYLFDTATNTALDFVVQGSVTSIKPVVPSLPPTFSLVSFANQQFRFTITGSPGSNYVVQATTNLTAPTWFSVLTNAAPFEFIESNAGAFPQRFYRLTTP